MVEVGMDAAAWLFARLASFALVLVAVLLPLALAGFALLSLPFAYLPLVLAWSALAGLMLMQLASLVQVIAPTRKAGALFSTLVFFPLLLVGRSFFPFENMPDFLAAIGQVKSDTVQVDLLTNTDLRTVKEFEDLIVKQIPPTDDAPGTIIRLSDVARVELSSEEPRMKNSMPVTDGKAAARVSWDADTGKLLRKIKR